MGRIDGRVALITGGESGIGLATARLLVARGAYVHLVGVNREALDAAGTELGPAQCALSVADVTSSEQVRAAVGDALERFGRLDVVFSNAGIAGDTACIEDYPEDVFRRVLDVHVVGTFLLLKYTLPHLGPGGSVIINSSVVGLTAEPAISGYATAKHAQVGLMRVAAREAAARGIRVNTIHPGPTDTPFQREVEKTATGLSPEMAFEMFNAMIPLGRHATPEEIARTVLYLASDDSAFTTGATLAVDGGMTI
ncbi:SDR family NAD(P)-dependent oxidoreductase [Streptomyces turgidiscabies]|uniref:Oxidoreductase, short chain dehydrogenase/reductase family protein n=1 Tax=Streptomyces turgidiscabies (strain Car8) TaxID=698760 RepID=L7ET83_STRT8|nr:MULTISPECIES: SDR family NAD(P)-dependent oxidoreductase [Streptomyces]ELP62608.1 oxidoreductase, short chain dehydrogenase/reductase family protein [Streptomyces turgidiscabies Car8]MDX3499689.1 SDR family NAD(P)-dependent oxidoreductase [Streptomyces turgidiscabies]GAQ73365.1 2,5-dichloro-2,5-cyclohexadiene-1,4-diol dehydrogenase [Streptomyces turgidiscabies]